MVSFAIDTTGSCRATIAAGFPLPRPCEFHSAVLPREVIPGLSAALWVLPLIVALSLGVARLLSSMGDAAGARGLDYAALIAGLAWLVVLACLVGALAQNRSRGPGSDE